MNISILGTEYSIEKGKTVYDDSLLESCAGYCDKISKKIVISKLRSETGNDIDASLEEQKVIRHEIIHAFLYESGLDVNSDWGSDETLVDWIALQFPKIKKALEEAEAL